jgi:hypothetical protein
MIALWPPIHAWKHEIVQRKHSNHLAFVGGSGASSDQENDVKYIGRLVRSTNWIRSVERFELSREKFLVRITIGLCRENYDAMPS